MLLGATAAISPFGAAPRFLAIDVPVMIAVSVLLVVVLWWRGGLGRAAGLGFVELNAAYVALMAAA